MSARDAWMPLYVGDYLADTMGMTVEQHGAYLLLLMRYWRSGPLPSEERELARSACCTLYRWRKRVWPALQRFFRTGEDGCWHQKRADAEVARADEALEQKRAAGRASAEARARQRAIQEAPQPAAQGIFAFSAPEPPSAVASPTTEAPASPMAASPAEDAIVAPQPDVAPIAASASEPAPAPLPIRDALWRDGVPILRALIGLSGRRARAFLGLLLRESHDDCARVYGALREAESLRPADPRAWLMRAAGPPDVGRRKSRQQRADEYVAQQLRLVRVFRADGAPAGRGAGPVMDGLASATG